MHGLTNLKIYLVWSCRENGPNATTKNYDSLETWRKIKTRPSPENLKRWNIYSHEWKRSKNGRMEQSKAMEYESRKASSDVLKTAWFKKKEGLVFIRNVDRLLVRYWVSHTRRQYRFVADYISGSVLSLSCPNRTTKPVSIQFPFYD